MAVDWEAKDRKITAGMIKGNVVTNAVNMSVSDRYSKLSLEECAIKVLALHTFVERIDVLDVVYQLKGLEDLKEELKSIKGIKKLIKWRTKNYDTIVALSDEEKAELKLELDKLKGE